MTLKERLEKAVQGIKGPGAALSHAKVQELGLIGREAATARQPHIGFPVTALLEAIGKVLQDGKITEADKPVVVAFAKDAYEKYVRPYDLPGIPVYLEGYVDDVLAGLLEPAIDQLFELLKSVQQPAPTSRPAETERTTPKK